MTLPISGQISLSDVNVELNLPATSQRSLNDSTTRSLFEVPSGAISMSHGYGKSALWSPEYTTTALWLDASDASTITLVSGNVSAWADKSGNNRNVSQQTSTKRPLYSSQGMNNKGTLVFNGSSSDLISTVGITSGTYSGQFSFFYVATRSNSIGGTILCERLSILVCPTQLHDHSGIYYISSDGLSGNSNHHVPASTFNLIDINGNLVFHTHTPGLKDEYWVGGTQQQVTVPVAASSINGNPGFLVGRREGTVGSFWGGNISEIVVVLGAVSSELRQKMEGYLAHKWGMTLKLPSNHPYKVNEPLK